MSYVSGDAYKNLGPWQIMDVGSIWMKEFASALCDLVPTVSWEPQMARLGALQTWRRSEQSTNPPLSIHRYPLQRGYARNPISWLAPYQRKLLPQLVAACPEPTASPLICTTPYYAPLAEGWPGPVIYYSTDLTFAYAGVNPRQVNRLDRRLCARANAVCPNSKRIASYFIERADCEPSKITVVPNATRAANISLLPLLSAGALPSDVAHLQRPIAGVIGNLAANMDWTFLAEAVRLTPEISWLFVGPTAMPVPDKQQATDRNWVMANASFVGGRPYAELQSYARAFDVAILPYIKKEPTFSGSSTRFYEHLAACRPMISTQGFAEVIEKPPLVTLVDSPQELCSAMARLMECDFKDGYESQRWLASKAGTWHERAKTLIETLLTPSATVADS